jgi:hypothetical protein
MKAKPVSGGGGAKPAPKKTVQSMSQAAKKMSNKSNKPGLPFKSKTQQDAIRSLAGRAARADNKTTQTTISAEKKRQLAVKAAAAKKAAIRAVPPRYGRAVGTPYVPKPKQLPKAY